MNKTDTVLVTLGSRSMNGWWFILTAFLFSIEAGGPAWALEFVADQITRIDRHSSRVTIFYRDEMWRLEHNRPGPVNVTIVRKDKDIVWHLLPSTKHFKTMPYDHEQHPKVAEQLEGEVSREAIGTELLDGHPTVLYEVVVEAPGGTREGYYQWLATDIHFPLKLAKKDGSWIIEYRHVRIGACSDLLFELPMNYLPLERFDTSEITENEYPAM